MATQSTTSFPYETEQAFEALFMSLDAVPDELCRYCGRGFHAMLWEQWHKIGAKMSWDPADPGYHGVFANLFANLIKMHRARCKPVGRYDDYWEERELGWFVCGTRQQGKESAMWLWFGLEHADWDEAPV